MLNLFTLLIIIHTITTTVEKSTWWRFQWPCTSSFEMCENDNDIRIPNRILYMGHNNRVLKLSLSGFFSKIFAIVFIVFCNTNKTEEAPRRFSCLILVHIFIILFEILRYNIYFVTAPHTCTLYIILYLPGITWMHFGLKSKWLDDIILMSWTKLVSQGRPQGFVNVEVFTPTPSHTNTHIHKMTKRGHQVFLTFMT